MPTSDLPTAADILHRFYAAERIYMSASPDEADFSGMAATLAPNIKLHQSPDLPYGGVYEGPEGFLQWSQEMSRYFDIVDVQNPQILEKADVVVVISTLKLRVRKSKQDWIAPFTQVIKVDREKGWITELRPFYWDVRGLNEVLTRTTDV